MIFSLYHLPECLSPHLYHQVAHPPVLALPSGLCRHALPRPGPQDQHRRQGFHFYCDESLARSPRILVKLLLQLDKYSGWYFTASSIHSQEIKRASFPHIPHRGVRGAHQGFVSEIGIISVYGILSQENGRIIMTR